MKHRRTLGVVIAGLVVIGVLALVLGWGRGARRSDAPGTAPASKVTGAQGGTRTTPALPDPRTLSPATIRGTVREAGGGPLAGAQVCSSWSAEGLDSAQEREPVCATTGADGGYQLASLVPGEHELTASAAGYAPRGWRRRSASTPRSPWSPVRSGTASTSRSRPAGSRSRAR